MRSRTWILAFSVCALLVGALMFAGIANAQTNGCYKASPACSGSCAWTFSCVPVPSSAVYQSCTLDDNGYDFAGSTNCGTCIWDYWPHPPNFTNCGPGLTFISC